MAWWLALTINVSGVFLELGKAAPSSAFAFLLHDIQGGRLILVALPPGYCNKSHPFFHATCIQAVSTPYGGSGMPPLTSCGLPQVWRLSQAPGSTTLSAGRQVG
jgi:hypothetical protein